MLARLFVFFGGLLVLALCIVLLAPFFVDWAGYRSAFEREASRIVGQPVRVEGTAKARILPFPSVTFSNVVIEGPDGIPAARIAAFSMDAELAPFLSGEILIFDMRIDRPDVQIKLAENGALLWSWPRSDVLKGSTIKLESVKIIEGRVTVERAGLEPVLLNGINGKVSAQALTGPWVADGQFSNGTTSFQARASTAAVIEGETLRMRLSLAPQNGFYDAAFDGRISFQNEAPVYAGRLEMTVLGDTQDAVTKREKLADVRGDFSADAGGIKVTGATLIAGPSDGPYKADGSLGLTFGKDAQFDIMLKGQQGNFGDIEGNSKSDRVTLGMPVAERLAALRNMLEQIPAPDIPGRVDLTLPALVIGDTIIRNAQVKAVPSKTGWRIEHTSVEMPGRTIIEGSGDLVLADELAFSGKMTFATKQPTGFANWLGLTASDAIRALPGAGFSARVDLSSKRQIFRDIEFRAGNTVLRGLVDRQVPQGALTQMSVQLTGENADLDVLSSVVGLANAESRPLASQGIDFSFRSRPVLGFGFQAEELEASGRFEAGDLELEQAKISGISGADITVSGNISNAILQPKGMLDVSIAAIDPAQLIEALATRFSHQNWLKTLGSRADLAGTALADGALTGVVTFGGETNAPQAFAADYRFDGAGLRFEGRLQDLAGGEISLSSKGEADNGETFLAAIGLPVNDTLTSLTALEPVRFEVSTLFKSGQIESGTLKAVSNSDVLETGFGQTPQPFNLVLADAAPFALATGYGLPGSAFGLPLNLKGEWKNTGQTFNLQNLDGVLADVPFSGQLDLTPGERPKLTGQVDLASINVIVFNEIIFGPLAATGDEKTPFSAGIGLPFDADVALTANEASGFAPLPLTKATARFVATKVGLRLLDFKAGMAGGQMTGAGEAQKNGVEVLLSFNGTLVGAEFSSIYSNGIAGSGDLQVELSGAGTTLEALKASVAGSGIFTSNGLAVDGISTVGFEDLVAEANAFETAPDSIAVLEMVERKLMLGQTRLPPLQAAFTITSGVARAPRSLITVRGGTLAFEPKFDLMSGEADINAQLAFDTGKDVSTGTVPAVNFNLSGPWNALNLVIDPQPLQNFLGERALEREEARVEAIQSALLEKQRLRRENRYYAGLIEARAKAEAERLAEIERLAKQAEEQEKLRLENEAARLQAIEDQKKMAPLPPAEIMPADNPADVPLDIDGLMRQLESAPLAPQP